MTDDTQVALPFAMSTIDGLLSDSATYPGPQTSLYVRPFGGCRF